MEHESMTPHMNGADLRVDIGSAAYEMGYVSQEADPSIVRGIRLLDSFDAFTEYMTGQREVKAEERALAIEEARQRLAEEERLAEREQAYDEHFIGAAHELRKDCVVFAEQKESNDRKIKNKQAEIDTLRANLEETEAAIARLGADIVETEEARDGAYAEGLAAQQVLANFQAESASIQRQYEREILQNADEQTIRDQFDTYGGPPRKHQGLNNLEEEQRRTYNELSARKGECTATYNKLKKQVHELVTELANGNNHKESLLGQLQERNQELAALKGQDQALQAEFDRIETELQMILSQFELGVEVDETPEPPVEETPVKPDLRIEIAEGETQEQAKVEEPEEKGWVPLGSPERPLQTVAADQATPRQFGSKLFRRKR